MQSPNPLLLLIVLSVFELNIAASDRIVLVAGGGGREPDDVPAREVKLKEPFGTAFDPQGRMVIVEMAMGQRVLRLESSGVIHHLAGTGEAGLGGDGVSLSKAQFTGPHNLAITPEGDILIADTWNGRIRKLDTRKDMVSTLAGFSVPPTKARSAGPYCIALDPTGATLYIADLLRVHAVDMATGKASVIAGNGTKGVPQDDAVAIEAPLVDPRAVAADRQGNVYILERGGNALRVVSKEGRIRTVVNSSGKKGSTGDGGLALAATMNGPKHLCVDLDDSVIIADAENQIIRRYTPRDGRITRVAGTGKMGKAGLGGPPEQAELARPHGVTIGPDGLLYITDSYNDRILRIEH